ncbi:hypothetical protein BHE74_00036807 [Ensete ventricosum]|nr:hypothetical protein BHE74_00036807 [Ensete ventricosum]
MESVCLVHVLLLHQCFRRACLHSSCKRSGCSSGTTVVNIDKQANQRCSYSNRDPHLLKNSKHYTLASVTSLVHVTVSPSRMYVGCRPDLDKVNLKIRSPDRFATHLTVDDRQPG